MKLYDLLANIAVVSLILTTIFWLVFGLTTMRKLDKAFVREGKQRPCQWDPIWGRAIWYTWPIVFSGAGFSDLENHLMDTEVVKRNINRIDKFLGWALFLSTSTMATSLIISLLFDFH